MRVPRHPHVRSSEILRYPCRRTDKAPGYRNLDEGNGERGGEVARRRSERASTSELSKSRTHNLHTSPSKRVNFSTASHILAFAPERRRPPSGRRLALSPHRFSFLPSFLLLAPPFHHLIPFDRPTGAGPQIIEAQLKRGKTWTWAKRISSSSFRLLFLSDPPFYIPPRLTRYPLGTRSIPIRFIFIPLTFFLLGFRIIQNPSSPSGYSWRKEDEKTRSLHETSPLRVTSCNWIFQLANYLEFPSEYPFVGWRKFDSV